MYRDWTFSQQISTGARNLDNGAAVFALKVLWVAVQECSEEL
ncbi:MAG: hypothetical protein ACK2UO_11485 [Caldilineaceae bacterium]